MIFRVLLALLLLTGAAQAQMNSFFPGPGTAHSTGGAGCSEATTFLARTTGLSAPETTAYTTLICGMVTDGTFTKMEALYIFATKDQATAVLNLKSTSFTAVLTGGGSATFVADQGITFNAVGDAYYDTGLVPSTSVLCTQNSCAVGVYIRTYFAASTSKAIGADNNAASYNYIMPVNGALTSLEYTLNDSTFLTAANTSSVGMWVASRTGSGSSAMYKNAAAFTSGSATSTTPPAFSMYIGAANRSGGAIGKSLDQFSAAFISSGLSAAEMTSVSNRINAYMTAFGVNIY